MFFTHVLWDIRWYELTNLERARVKSFGARFNRHGWHNLSKHFLLSSIKRKKINSIFIHYLVFDDRLEFITIAAREEHTIAWHRAWAYLHGKCHLDFIGGAKVHVQ